MGNFKVKVNSEAESREVQELFQKLSGKENGFITVDKSIRWVALYQGQVVQYEFLPSVEFKQITLPKLRAMVNPMKEYGDASVIWQRESEAESLVDWSNVINNAQQIFDHENAGTQPPNDQSAEIEQVCQHRHYFIDVSDVDEIDFYEIALRYNVTDPCIQHILKKCLAVGQRGQKDFHHDLKDIYDTAKRMLDVHGLDS